MWEVVIMVEVEVGIMEVVLQNIKVVVVVRVIVVVLLLLIYRELMPTMAIWLLHMLH